MSDLNLLEIPKSKISQFEKKGIYSIEDLVQYFPKKYFDFTNPKTINQLIEGHVVAVEGSIINVTEGEKFLKAIIRDKNGSKMDIVWFNQKYVKKKLKEGTEYLFCGTIHNNTYKNQPQMISPICFSDNIDEYKKIIPSYRKIQGMSEEYLLNSIDKALELYKPEESLPSILLDKYKLCCPNTALKNIHNPESRERLVNARKRFVVEDLYYFAKKLRDINGIDCVSTGMKYEDLTSIKEFLGKLPFELTDGQREVLRESCRKLKQGERLNSLVLGDVGCGKTIVALILLLLTKYNGGQSVMMCPTTVLAKQHYQDFLEKTDGFDINIAFLSSDTKKRERNKILKEVKAGEIDILVGTHSVIGKDVEFKNLTLTVVDEEHKFGVVQRESLKEKSKNGVHSVSMSATPIPRTLAMVLHGEGVDIHKINSMPKGRKTIKTSLVEEKTKVLDFMYDEIKKGRQCYFICPLVEDSETMSGVESLESVTKEIQDYFKNHTDVNIGSINGKKMKQDEIEEEIGKFARNEYQILVSTTIVEVGVNVPNSTVIAINNAERFGLAQLHQLRGRVGRGSHQSHCILISKDTQNQKLEAMRKFSDGYKIAEKDLEIRGAGEFIGVKQSGDDKYLSLAMKYPDVFSEIRKNL